MMPRTSPSVGALAAALAKAQAELVNPDKTLTATVFDGRGGGTRNFRYAPLSRGLDVVRKSLSRFEIAVIQTTSVDGPNNLINLTTTLAHASGEWISAEWPVCSLADSATPRRSGAALTYARRYALFMIVGIAGEDDLDAPDLNDDVVAPSEALRASVNGARDPGPQRSGARSRKSNAIQTRSVLPPEASAALREALGAELDSLTTVGDLTTWARRVLSAKNTLTDDDARDVEASFAVKAAALASPSSKIEALSESVAPKAGVEQGVEQGVDPGGRAVGAGEPRGIPSLQKIPRHRDKAHLRFVGTQGCLVCGRQPCDAHHLRFAQRSSLGRKVSDQFTVPLCRAHHRDLHLAGNEKRWWAHLQIEPQPIAEALWSISHSQGVGQQPA